MQTKRVLTSQAVPGMVVAEDIYTFNNQMILGRGSKLTNRTITRLKFYSINDFNIVVDDEADAAKEAPAPEKKVRAYAVPRIEKSFESLGEYIKKAPEFKKFNQDYEASITAFENTLKNFAANKAAPLDTNELLLEAESILYNRRNNMHLLHMLHNMRNYQDETYAHSLSVALICNAMGNWLKLSPDDIRALTLAGLLHDIGKLFMPKKLLKKNSALTEAEFSMIKTHPRKGYNALRSQNIDERIKQAVLMHHERCDGSGYPSNMTGDRIGDFAKIVAIADTYDAMTSPRIYRSPLCPFEAISLFQSEGLNQFDPQYLLTFMEGTVDSYLHSRVRLNNGVEGEVVIINRSDFSRPTIKAGDKYINLLKESGLHIESMA